MINFGLLAYIYVKFDKCMHHLVYCSAPILLIVFTVKSRIDYSKPEEVGYASWCASVINNPGLTHSRLSLGLISTALPDNLFIAFVYVLYCPMIFIGDTCLWL